MRYKESREQSAELLRQALALMGQHEAAFHPVSFAVWYEHAAGINGPLSQAIQRAQEREPRLGDDTLVRLFQDHVAEADASAVQRISSELQRMMAGMAEGAVRTGDQAGSFGAQLRDLTEALRSNEPVAVAQLMTQALASTTQMRSAAQELEQQVLASHREIARLQGELSRVRDEALLDPLTQVLNRKGFDQRLAAVLAEPATPDAAHCLIMFDIDHFKQVNDRHGHVMGDRVIQAMGEVLRSCVSDRTHAVARYGGEEFAVLLPGCSLDFSRQLADTVRQRTKAMKVRDRRTQQVVLTISISGGVAALRPGDDAQALIERADAALYRSKQAGRDCVTCA